MSESQERMMAVVTPAHLDDFLAVCAKWEVTATVLGEVTDTGRLQMHWQGELIVDLPPRTAAHEGPVYERPIERPLDQDVLIQHDGHDLPRPRNGDELRATVLRMVASANLADKSWITDQYDRWVMGNTVLAQPEDAGMLRLDESTTRGIALSVDGNGALHPARPVRRRATRTGRGVPQRGDDAARARSRCRTASTSVRPRIPPSCGSSPRPCAGSPTAASELGTPVTGGNVSFYNQTGTSAILPTPVVGVLGVIDDVHHRTRQAFRTDGATDLPARHEPRRVRRLGVGARAARLPRRAAARGRLRGERALAELLIRAGRGRTARLRARSRRGRAGPGARRMLPARSCRRADHAARRRRPVRRAVQRVDSTRGRFRDARERGRVHRVVRGTGGAADVRSASSTSSRSA